MLGSYVLKSDDKLDNLIFSDRILYCSILQSNFALKKYPDGIFLEAQTSRNVSSHNTLTTPLQLMEDGHQARIRGFVQGISILLSRL